jgi:hypothetical protein
MKKVIDTVRQGKQGPFLVMTETEFSEADNLSQGICMACGEPKVYGMAEALLMNRVRIEDEEAHESI